MDNLFFTIKIEETESNGYHCQVFFYLGDTSCFVDTAVFYIQKLDYQDALFWAIIEQGNLIRRMSFSIEIDKTLSQIEKVDYSDFLYTSNPQYFINHLQSSDKHKILMDQVKISGYQFVADRLNQIKDYPEFDHLIAFYVQNLYSLDKELLRNIDPVDLTKYKFTRWVIEGIIVNEGISYNPEEC